MADMFSGERLRADLRGLQRLCAEMRPPAGGDAESEAVAAAKSTPLPLCLNAELLLAVHERRVLQAAIFRRPHIVAVKTQRADYSGIEKVGRGKYHHGFPPQPASRKGESFPPRLGRWACPVSRTLLAGGLLLRALEALPWGSACSASVSPLPPCGCVSRPARLSAAPLVALLWEQVCRLKVCAPPAAPAAAAPQCSTRRPSCRTLLSLPYPQAQARRSQAGDAPDPDGGAAVAVRPSRGYSSCAAQTEASCLRRCEACCVAEAAVKSLVEAFCAKLEDPAVAERRSQVEASLCPGRLSQWGAMRALTSALCSDLDAVLCSKGAALAAVEVERSAVREAEREAQRLVHLADRRAEQGVVLLEAEKERAIAEEANRAASKRVSELEAQGETPPKCGQKRRQISLECRHVKQTERSRIEELGRVRKAEEAARGRAAELQGQLQATRQALEEANARLRHAEEELRRSKLHAETVAEALKAEQSRLRKQVKQSQERHALLLKYPDLHGPLQPLQHEAGDPVLDMECQVQANEVRMSLLTTQNERLRATIAKLRVLAASGRPPTRNHSRRALYSQGGLASRLVSADIRVVTVPVSIITARHSSSQPEEDRLVYSDILSSITLALLAVLFNPALRPPPTPSPPPLRPSVPLTSWCCRYLTLPSSALGVGTQIP
ncbi:Coiled-coil domain-containing protein 157 [Frankliniella fusca]|uniref:Coiled-coil domain-containing protein 157 n=1 Tax=Frankliniella fusca TaxID=407009 RepID=A0AAE1I323_9NEOP|nr:Coiled-coil domain-containing protein 157 [Frankliniella fusca]